MEITLNKKKENHGHINIKFGETDYKNQVEEKLKEYGKKASMKGFRPGKVPAGLIKKMYGKSIKVEEINKLVSEAVQNYIKDEDLKLVGDPLPQSDELDNVDWVNQSDFELNYEVGLIPEFDLPVSDKVKFTRHIIPVDDKTLNKTLFNIQKQNGERSDLEEINDKSILGGELVNEEEELKQASELDLSLLTPAERKKFLGKKVGDKVEFNPVKGLDKDPDELVKMFNKPMIEVKKMKGKFIFEINKIDDLKLAELNKELFDRVIGPDKADNEEDFKKEVKEIVQKNHDKESDSLLDRDMQDNLLEKSKLDLPNEFLKKWLLISNDGKVTEEQIEKEFEFYLKELKWNIIISKIQKDAEIEIKHEDVVKETEQMVMGQFGGSLPPEQMQGFLDQFVQNYLKENNGQNYMNVHKRLLDRKVLDWIKDQVSIKDKKVTWEEFEKIVTK